MGDLKDKLYEKCELFNNIRVRQQSSFSYAERLFQEMSSIGNRQASVDFVKV